LKPDPNVNVLVAAKDLRKGMVVDNQAVISSSVPKSGAPKDYLSNSVQAVGKVLDRDMKEGEAFTPAHFAAENAGSKIAATLPPGKRAVAISVSNFGALDGLLNPG